MFSKRVALAAALSTALLAGACGGGSGGSDSDTVVLAVAGPMTGDSAEYGQQQLAGIQLAVDQYTEDGGIPEGPLKGKKIKVVKYDDAGDPNQAASVAQKICDDGDVMGVFGHVNSSATLAAEPIYERCGVPLIVSYSSNPEITAELHENLFRTLVDDAKLGAEMASFAQGELKGTKVGVISSDDDYGVGLKENFEATAKELDLDVAKSLVTTTGQKDFSPQLTELKNAGIDSLVLLNLYTDAALQIKQAKALGLDVPILVTASANNPELVNIAGAEAAEGTYVSAIFDPGSSSEGTQAFVSAFKEANDREPSEGAAVAYDSAWVVFKAFDEGAEDRKSLISTIDGIESFDLPIVGEFVFNENHEPTVVPGKPSQSLLQVQDGEIKTRPGA